MFIRCARCGGAAHPALAHLHGLMDALCKRCTDTVVARRQKQMKELEWRARLAEVTKQHIENLFRSRAA